MDPASQALLFAVLSLPVVWLALAYVVAPLVAWRSHTVPIDPRWRPAGQAALAALPTEALRQVDGYRRALERLGFESLPALVLPDATLGTPSFAFPARHREDATLATVQVLWRDGRVALRRMFVVLTTTFDNGSEVVTTDLADPARTPQPANRSVARLPGLRDPALLHRVHRARVDEARDTAQGRRVPGAPPEADAVAAQLRRDVLSDVDAAVQAGWLAPRGERVGLTLRGAFLSAWRGLWPLGRRHRRATQREALRLFERLGIPLGADDLVALVKPERQPVPTASHALAGAASDGVGADDTEQRFVLTRVDDAPTEARRVTDWYPQEGRSPRVEVAGRSVLRSSMPEGALVVGRHGVRLPSGHLLPYERLEELSLLPGEGSADPVAGLVVGGRVGDGAPPPLRAVLPSTCFAAGHAGAAAAHAAITERLGALPDGAHRLAGLAQTSARTRVIARRPTPVVSLWAAATVVVSAAQLAVAEGEPFLATMLLGGAAPGLMEAGEWWRAVPASLLHFGALHVVAVVFGLLTLGARLESVAGSARIAIVLLASALAAYGPLALLAEGPAGSHPQVGGSAILAGLVGAWAATLQAHGHRPPLYRFAVPRPLSKGLLALLTVLFALEATRGWFVHLGALLAGGAVMAALVRLPAKRGVAALVVPQLGLRAAGAMAGAVLLASTSWGLYGAFVAPESRLEAAMEKLAFGPHPETVSPLARAVAASPDASEALASKALVAAERAALAAPDEVWTQLGLAVVALRVGSAAQGLEAAFKTLDLAAETPDETSTGFAHALAPALALASDARPTGRLRGPLELVAEVDADGGASLVVTKTPAAFAGAELLVLVHAGDAPAWIVSVPLAEPTRVRLSVPDGEVLRGGVLQVQAIARRQLPAERAPQASGVAHWSATPPRPLAR